MKNNIKNIEMCNVCIHGDNVDNNTTNTYQSPKQH